MTEEIKNHCVICGISKSQKGILIGIVASVVIHVGVFYVLNQVNVKPRPAKRVQVIDLGEIEIKVPNVSTSFKNGKEI